jgi:hypothetical protein
MKNTKYVLLFIGIIAISFTIYNLIQGESFSDQIISLVCGSSLIYGYYQLGKFDKKDV